MSLARSFWPLSVAVWLVLALPAWAQPAGYVPDAACAPCHAELFRSYQDVGMARSLARPENASPIERFDAAPFFHAASGRFYEIRRDGTGLVFRRWRLNDAGARADLLELPVAYVLGSGHTSRVYLYRTPSGELYQLPLAWYSQGAGWAMAPGYDRADHEEVSRRVRRECLFCHNAYPQAEPGSDRHEAFPRFPAVLPEGIGCQRCHGPGAAHIDLVQGGETRPAEIARSIVQPARLSPSLQRDVCYQCHLQPSVTLIGPRRFGRGDYSFRPGEKLADYLVHVDPVLHGRPRAERFEINHHPYRLEQSACFRQSAGRLSCLSCHDPHRKVPVAERAAHYRAACLECHTSAESCRRGPEWASDERARAENCVGCHMPRRRTQDVVHVVMTDHHITRPPDAAAAAALVAPLAEFEPQIDDVELYPLDGSPTGRLAQIYRAITVLGVVRSQDALDYLEKALPLENLPHEEPLIELASARLRRQQWSGVLSLLERFKQPPAHLLQWRAIAEAGLGHGTAARDLLRQAIALDPLQPELHFNLGRLLLTEDPAAAETFLARAAELRPNLAAAWYHLGHARAAQGKTAEALAAWRQALVFDPGHHESRRELLERVATKTAGAPSGSP